MIFRRVKTLVLSLDTKRSTDWIEQLSSFVNFETVKRVKIARACKFGPRMPKVDDIGQCLRGMPNLQSLIILCDVLSKIGFLSSSHPSIMPSSVKHLTLSIHNFKDCMRILERFDQLWTFMWSHYERPTEEWLQTLKQWLDEKRPGSAYEDMRGLFHIWLGQERMISRNKRRKHDP